LSAEFLFYIPFVREIRDKLNLEQTFHYRNGRDSRRTRQSYCDVSSSNIGTSAHL